MSLIDRSPSLGPFVRLPAPHADVLLTTLVPGDAAALVELYNTPSIGHRLYSIPFPFSTTDGEQAIAKEEPSRAALQARFAADDGRPLDAFPLTAIRIETEDSTRLIGTIGLHAADAHPAFPFREACWDLGYALLPSYGGRGIGTAAPRAALAAWEQLSNVKAYGAFVETDNPSSIRVLQKLGFEHIAEFDEDWPEAKGGGTRRNIRLEKVVTTS